MQLRFVHNQRLYVASLLSMYQYKDDTSSAQTHVPIKICILPMSTLNVDMLFYFIISIPSLSTHMTYY